MKNIFDILTEYGIEVPEDQKEAFGKAVLDNYRTIADYEKAVTARDTYKASLDEVNGQLEGFKDVNVDDLKNQIASLQKDLKDKDDEFASQLAERDFSDAIESAIREAGGRNAKAIKAILDLDALRSSKNQADDIKKALDGVKESDAYLFGQNEPINNGVRGTGSQGGKVEDMSSIRALMGLPAEKER